MLWSVASRPKDSYLTHELAQAFNLQTGPSVIGAPVSLPQTPMNQTINCVPIVNALMHRDYSITGTQVSVEVYDDRVEITNPGGLVKGLTQKALGKGISIRRNELISDLFFRLDKVERVGQGIQNMKDAMRAAGLREPEFEADGFFRATFHRSPEFSLKRPKVVVEKIAEKDLERLTTQKIADAIRQNPEVTREELATFAGITSDGIKYHLRRMRKNGVIRRIGPNKGGHWEISDKLVPKTA